MKTIVRANIKIYIAGEDTPIEELHNASFRVGDGDTIPGIIMFLCQPQWFLSDCISQVWSFLLGTAPWERSYEPSAAGSLDSALMGDPRLPLLELFLLMQVWSLISKY
jgi:hypothetical protein